MARQLRWGNVAVELTAEAETDIQELTLAECHLLEEKILEAVKRSVKSLPQPKPLEEIPASIVVDGLTIFMAISRFKARIRGIQSTILHSPLSHFQRAIVIPFFVRNVPVSLTGSACADIKDYPPHKMRALKEALPLAVRRVLDWLPTPSDEDGFLVRTAAYGFSFFMYASWSQVRIMEIRTTTSPDSISGPVRARIDRAKGTISIFLPKEPMPCGRLFNESLPYRAWVEPGVPNSDMMNRIQIAREVPSGRRSAQSGQAAAKTRDRPARRILDLVA